MSYSKDNKDNKDIERDYSIGGRDKNGKYHFNLLRLAIYKKGRFFAKRGEHSISTNGGSIGKVKSVAEGRKELHAYALAELNDMKATHLRKIEAIDDALALLASDPAFLEKFGGT